MQKSSCQDRMTDPAQRRSTLLLADTEHQKILLAILEAGSTLRVSAIMDKFFVHALLRVGKRYKQCDQRLLRPELRRREISVTVLAVHG